MSEPNWAKLKEVGTRLEELKASGELDWELYDRLADGAEAAAGGDGRFLDFLIESIPDFPRPAGDRAETAGRV